VTAIRIGNCSGYYGDRLGAMREMLEGGDLDYLTGDYLAELTMLILGRDRIRDDSLGYARTFVRQMTDSMALAKELGVKIVANAGGLNPSALAAKLRGIAAGQGLELTIAHVEGDDLRERAGELELGPVLTANAYLGAFGIAAALQSGADVVVTGRVTDASVVVGTTSTGSPARSSRATSSSAGLRRRAATSPGSPMSTCRSRWASRSPRSTPTDRSSSPSTRAPGEPSRSTP
jgi:hypothetical protein